MLKKFLKKNWLIIAIIVLASFFRLYRISDYMEFLGDQARDVSIIRDFWKHGNLFFIGPQTSIGNMYLGPFFYYLIAPALLLSGFNPVGPAIFIALLGIATVYLVYFIGNRWFSRSVGLISAFLFAISPVVIKYSNFIWNPNVMPFFSLLFIYFFFEAFRTKKYQNFLYASLAFIMVMNSHYLGLALLPFTGLFWLFNLVKFIKSKSKQLKPFVKYTVLAAVIFALSLTPQLLFDFKHDGQNIKALINFFAYRETTVNIKAYKAIPEMPAMFNQINTNLLAGTELNVTGGIIISIVFALLILFTLIKSKKQKSAYWIVFAWYLSGIVALALYKQHVYPHYFAFLFPAVFIFIGYLINRYKIIGFPFLILITVFSLMQNPFRWNANYQLKTASQVADSIVSASNNQDFNYALLSKMGYGFSYFFEENPHYLKLDNKVTDQLFVACVPFQIECNPINNPEWSVAAFGWAKIDSQWEINGVKIFKLVHNIDGQKQN